MGSRRVGRDWVTNTLQPVAGCCGAWALGSGSVKTWGCHGGGGAQEEGVSVHIELTHLVLQQKLARHCKATIYHPPKKIGDSPNTKKGLNSEQTKPEPYSKMKNTPLCHTQPHQGHSSEMVNCLSQIEMRVEHKSIFSTHCSKFLLFLPQNTTFAIVLWIDTHFNMISKEVCPHPARLGFVFVFLAHFRDEINMLPCVVLFVEVNR